MLSAELDGQPGPYGDRDVVPVCGKVPAQLDRPLRLGAGRLFISIAFAGPVILSVSIEGVFNSFAPAGNVRVGNVFLSLHAYFVAKVLVVSDVEVIWYPQLKPPSWNARKLVVQ